MNVAYRVYLALAGGMTLALTQYFIHQPWRYLITSAELVILGVFVVALWGRTKELTELAEEHQARLDAIANVASRAQIVRDANQLVDAITESLYVHQVRERVELPE